MYPCTFQAAPAARPQARWNPRSQPPTALPNGTTGPRSPPPLRPQADPLRTPGHRVPYPARAPFYQISRRKSEGIRVPSRGMARRPGDRPTTCSLKTWSASYGCDRPPESNQQPRGVGEAESSKHQERGHQVVAAVDDDRAEEPSRRVRQSCRPPRSQHPPPCPHQPQRGHAGADHV